MDYNEYKKYLSPVLTKRTDLIIEKGEGSFIYDIDGKKYLDFVQGIATNPLGHCHKDIVSAIKNQCDKMISGPLSFYDYPPILELSEKLVKYLPGDIDNILYSNSGGEANEGAIKLAKFYTKRNGIISFLGAYHGKNFAALSATTVSAGARSDCGSMLSDTYIVPYPTKDQCPKGYDEDERTNYCLGEIKKVFDYIISPDNVAAFIMEPILGDGGYFIPPKSFIKAIRDICDRYGILLIFDEVQTGFGRTGKMFACEHFEVVPDIITLGKPMASGMPLSALCCNSLIMKKWKAGKHGGGTFGGNPLSTASSLALLKVYEKEDILSGCIEKGNYFINELQKLKQKYSCVEEVRGIGLFIAMEFSNEFDDEKNNTMKKIWDLCLEKGLIVATCGLRENAMRFIPPLNVSFDEIDQCILILDESIKDIYNKFCSNKI